MAAFQRHRLTGKLSCILLMGLHIELTLFGVALDDPSTSRWCQIWNWWQLQLGGQQKWPPREAHREHCQQTEYHFHQSSCTWHHWGKPLYSTAVGGFFNDLSLDDPSQPICSRLVKGSEFLPHHGKNFESFESDGHPSHRQRCTTRRIFSC